MLIISDICPKFRNHLCLINQMTQKISCYIVLSLVWFVISGQSGYAQVTLQDAIETTLERNLQIKQAEFGYQLSAEDLFQAKSERYPNLNFGVDNSYVYGLTFDQTSGRLIRGNDWTTSAGAQLSSSVTLFQGFQRLNQIKANKIQLLVDATEVEKVKNDLILSVVTNYLEAITNGELQEAALQQVKLSREQL